ncbi:MAG: alpha-glucan family phosphorylase [Acidimicrobiia bacterium]|nr:alpha-glucan family phosphorylase [Acidimicrobiia bacterium]NNK92325.1 alpha-glucan family phosphorylase [Acidimicrobiia bacterium]
MRNHPLVGVPSGPIAPVRVPKAYRRLLDLAYNLWWTWDPLAYDLWARIDPRRWAESRNPLSVLPTIEPDTWEALEASTTFAELYGEVLNRFDAYMGATDTWFDRNHPGFPGPIAYLCTEFGTHHTLPFYSGGLGVLAGDHLKAASDLGLPLMGVGIFYRRGYFRQAVDPDGHQQHTYTPVETTRRPMRQLLDPSTGRPIQVSVEFPDREVHARLWRIDVGRVPLVLLDTDVPDNDPADRPIGELLYVRGREMRFCQEMILGIGGTRAIKALDVDPAVWHVNEGHAAMGLLERLSNEIGAGKSLDDAKGDVASNTLFTLHTPVPAGNERFDYDLAHRYLSGSLPGITDDVLRDVSRAREGDDAFDLGAIAIRMSSITNGVSQRHGDVVKNEWAHLLEGKGVAVTNGVHSPTWVGRNMARLFQKTLGEEWVDKLVQPEAWKAIHDVKDKVLWDTHIAQKEIMNRQLRARLRIQASRHGRSPRYLRWIDDQLPAERLTIGFARRFATYKRAALLFSDPGRFRSLVTNPDRPVQVVFAGKAHPADREGQALIRWVQEMSNSPDLAGHIFFIEGYDMALGHALVSGCDVWLNNPRPPAEASGTSGMKAASNGALNLSVLDGWWVEGYDGDNGWGFSEHSHSDAEDAGILYHLLESQVVPEYYDRDDDGIPQAWVKRMKDAIATVTPNFSMARTVADYTEMAYAPLAKGETPDE